jgi:anaerobic selenocysteine-containing dehydrogenase
MKMVVVQSGNPLVTMADSRRTRAAFEKLETLVVIDMFMTETAKLADVILPAASCYEETQLTRVSIRKNTIFLQDAVITPVGDSWPDWKIVFELGRRLGLEQEFPLQTAEEAIDFQLEPAGVSVADLRANGKGLRIEELRYEKYREQPFKTPSGTVELYSSRLGEAGFSGVPFALGLGPSPISFAARAMRTPCLASAAAVISGSPTPSFAPSPYS